MGNRTATLTEREKEVLRHVHALRTSSQIAHSLQIAEVSVNKRIDSARRKLGGISRRQAALLLAEEEGAGYDNLIPAEIVLNVDDKELAEAVPDDVGLGERKGGLSSAAPTLEGQRNALDLWQRLGVIALSMAGLALAASVYLALLKR